MLVYYLPVTKTISGLIILGDRL